MGDFVPPAHRPDPLTEARAPNHTDRTSPAPRNGGTLQSVVLALLAAGIMLAGVWRYLSVQGLRSYLPDEGIYTFVGWSWLHGDWPYRDTWDHKGPVVFAVPLIRTALLGSAPERTAVQEVVLGILTAVLLAAAAKRLWGKAAAALTAVLSVLLWTQLGPTGGHMSTAGSIIALLNAVCILFAARAMTLPHGRSRGLALFALGLAGGLGFLAKPNAIGACVAGAFTFLWVARQSGWRQLLRYAGWFTLGVVVPMVVTAITFALAGALPQLIDVAYVYNATVRGPTILAEYGLVGMTARVVRGLLRLHVFMPVVATLLASVLAFGQRNRPLPDGQELVPGPDAIAAVWLVLELLIYTSNGVYGHHIFPVLFAVALASGWLLHLMLRLLPAGHRIWAAVPIVLLCAWPLAEHARLHRPVEQQKPDWRRVGERIRRETDPAERVLAFARQYGPSVLSIAERRTAIRYIHTPALYVRGYASDERWGEVVSLLSGERAPRFVVISSGRPLSQTAGNPAAQLVVEALDESGPAGPLVDPTPWPNRYRVKALLVERYDVDYCDGVICVMRLK